MDEKIRARTLRAIEEGVFPGCVIGLIQMPRPPVAFGGGGNKQIVIPVGTIDGSVPVQENTIYDVASITKPIPTASLALMFVAEGKLSLRDLVKKHLPELHNDHGATLEDLLRYRVSGPPMSRLRFKTFEEIRTHVFERGFNGPPSLDTIALTNLPAFLLGLVVERVGGAKLPELAHRYFFEPLSMTDTSFFPLNPDTSNMSGRTKLMGGDDHIAPTEIVDGEEIRGIVHDESARVFARVRRAVGHAGLFATVPDLLNFLQQLLAHDGFTKPVISGAQEGLGWEVDREWMGAFAKAPASQGANVFGKTGFTGTSILCDVERGIGLVILSNRTYPHRPVDNSAINAFRKDIADIVLG